MNVQEIEYQLRSQFPLYFLEMNESQQKFIRVKTNRGTTPKRRLYEAGNKSGKSQIGLAEDIAHCYGFRPWLDEDDSDYSIQIRPNCKGLIGCETLSQSVMQKIWPTLEMLIPKTSQYKEKKNPMGQVGQIDFFTDCYGEKCESQIFIRSYDQEPRTFEGIDYDFIHWDEPPPKKVLQAAERGKITTNAPSWFTMTPLKEAYIYDDYSLKAANVGGEDDEIAVIRASTWDNCADWCYLCNLTIPENAVGDPKTGLSVRKVKNCPKCGRIMGFMLKAGIVEYFKTLDPEEMDAREKGLWRHLSGLVYKELDRDVHQYEDFQIPKSWMKIEGLDPHDAKPTKYIFAAVSPEEVEIEGKMRNKIYFHDHLLSKGENMDSFIRRIKMTREKHGYSKPKWIVIDAKYGRRSELHGDKGEKTCWQDELTKRGLGYIILSQSSPGDVELGHKIVREYLKPFYSMLAGKAKPGIVFAKHGCAGKDGPIHQMFNYQYKANSDKSDDEFKDFPDVIRYICLEQPIYKSPESEKLVVTSLEERRKQAYGVRRREAVV